MAGFNPFLHKRSISIVGSGFDPRARRSDDNAFAAEPTVDHDNATSASAAALGRNDSIEISSTSGLVKREPIEKSVAAEGFQDSSAVVAAAAGDNFRPKIGPAGGWLGSSACQTCGKARRVRLFWAFSNFYAVYSWLLTRFLL